MVSDRVANFRSDNVVGVHDAILHAIAAANTGTAPSYGHDAWSVRAEARLREVFACDLEAYFVLTGTAANALALATVCPPHGQVLCHAESHVVVDECGAPMVAIPGGEPLIHREIGEIVKGFVARKKFVSLCTNALLLEKKLHLFEPSPYLFFSVHLDGMKEHHDKAVSQEGVFEKAVSAIKAAQAKGFTVNVNATIFDGHSAEDIAKYLDFAKSMGVGVSISPGV